MIGGRSRIPVSWVVSMRRARLLIGPEVFALPSNRARGSAAHRSRFCSNFNFPDTVNILARAHPMYKVLIRPTSFS